MATFALSENPDGEGTACVVCHTQGGDYNLKVEALAGADIGAHEGLSEDAVYDDCLACHNSGEDPEFRQLLHTVHMQSDNSHAPESCWSCHIVEGYGPDSPSGQDLEG